MEAFFMSARRKVKPKKVWNRNIPDSVLLCRGTSSLRDNPESLHPSISTIERALAGEARAREIISAWAFIAPVVTVGCAA
jgi:hypothetical protein